jgi:signal transduction histidine kinase
MGYIDLLTLEAGERLGEASLYVERMGGSARYMQQLINDLVALSRIGRLETKAEEVDLAVVITEVRTGIETAQPGANFVIGALPNVRMSPVRARQLFTHLLDNAVRHAGRGDVTVVVRAEHLRDGGARVSVADDGRAIPASEHERVFGVFERLEERATGVGLTVCRKIAELLGGTVQIADVPVGARVDLVLPPAAVVWHEAPVGVGG